VHGRSNFQQPVSSDHFVSAIAHSTRRFWYWLTLVPLILGASLALMRYAGWSAIYSAYYGLPSEAWRLKEAGPKADLYRWLMMGLAVTATIVATILIPPFKSETLPVGLKGVTRFVLAVVLVAGSILIVTYGVLAVGHYLK
jgi:hypothetical protein